MSVWEISGWDEGPHWDVAVVTANNGEEAKDLLAAHLAANIDTEGTCGLDGVWDVQPRDKWHASPSDGPVHLALGSGCR